jgi:hypothetical protein
LAYPTQEEFLVADPLLGWIDEQFLRPDPFAFQGVAFRDIVQGIAGSLGVDPNGIFIVGSGAVGLSFNPENVVDGALGQYGEDSDLDLAVISEVHFETGWRDLRRAAQPTLDEMDSLVRENLAWQKKRFFDGTLLANRLLPALSFGPEWATALVRVAESIAVALDREVEKLDLWIYRDYWSLRNYVASGMVRCRERIM